MEGVADGAGAVEDVGGEVVDGRIRVDRYADDFALLSSGPVALDADALTLLELDLRFEPDPFLIHADPSQIQRLLGNLLTNAAQAMDMVGTIRLVTEHDGDRVRITIQLIDVEDGFNLWSRTYSRGMDDILELQKKRRTIRVSAPVRKYITDIVHATRSHPAIQFGASPRGSPSGSWRPAARPGSRA